MAYTNNSMIKRGNLISILDSISDEQIIYICAPAGYGKTVAIKQWLGRGGCRHILLPLDEFDNNPAHFCERFCETLANCQPDNKKLNSLFGHPGFDNAPAEFTVRAISALSKNVMVRLAIDDLHFVHDEMTLQLLQSFLKRLPECFQITLISRDELPSCFSELWLKGNIAKVDADKLRFSSDEIIALYEKRGISISQETACEVQHYTHGWAIGLAALLLSGGEPQRGNLEYLDEFVRVNVWQRLDERIREFILRTAVIGELTPVLCVELTDMIDSGELLESLVRQSIFISRTEQGSYRFHRLFQDFLLKELARRSEGFSHALLKKAGYWYLSQRDFHNAMSCFIKLEDYEGIEQCYMLLITDGKEYFSIDKMISIAGLPLLEKVAGKFPYVYSHLIWTAYIKGRAGEMARYADLYYANQSEIVRLVPQLALNIILVFFVDFRHSLSDIMQSAGSLAHTNPSASASVSVINQNFPLLHRGTRDFSIFALGSIDEHTTQAKNALYGLFGEQAELLAECLNAGLLYEQGNHEKAHSHALSVNAALETALSPEVKFFIMAIMVSILDALNQSEKADDLQSSISDMIEKDDAHYLLYNFNALKTRRRLSCGDTEAALAWLAEYTSPVQNSLEFYELYGHITTCRAYLTIGDYDSAVIMLKKVLRLVEAYNRPLDIIEAHILLSIAFWKKKSSFQNEAITHLEQALSLAHGYGFTQLFLNEGTELTSMLLRIKRRAEQHIGEKPLPPGFVKMLCLSVQNMPDTGMTSSQSEKIELLKFTAKQQNVMKLLVKGKSYREMADVLSIKRPSLRSHLNAIYSKLGVTDGTEAIKRIQAMRIFDAD